MPHGLGITKQPCACRRRKALRFSAMVGMAGSGYFTLSPQGRGKDFSVTIPRRALGVGDVLVFDRRLEHHAAFQLIDHAALDFLPGRLAFRELVATLALQRLPAARELGVRYLDVRSALVEVDPDDVAGLHQREP